MLHTICNWKQLQLYILYIFALVSLGEYNVLLAIHTFIPIICRSYNAYPIAVTTGKIYKRGLERITVIYFKFRLLYMLFLKQTMSCCILILTELQCRMKLR